MRLLVDLGAEQVEALRVLGEVQRVSRAELIRRAVAGYLEQHREGLAATAGLWRGRGEDGLDYERALRAEWER